MYLFSDRIRTFTVVGLYVLTRNALYADKDDLLGFL